MKKNRVVFLQRDWEDNLGLLWLTACLNREGFDARVLVEEARTYQEIESLEPAMVGYSCITGQQDWVLGSIARLRARGLKSLFAVGGPHPTFYPRMVESQGIDCIVRGEGEMAVVELMRRIEGGGDIHSSPNTSWRIDGETKENPLLPLLENLDDLPFPDRSYYGRYPFLATAPYRQVITSRGCPFQCSFCFNHALHAMYGRHSRYIRRHSADYALEEIRLLKRRWGVNELRFSDDHFVLSAEWLADFMPRYAKEIGAPFVINARVDALDEEKIRLLAAGGCRLVCFGIETGREDLRNDILNKKITDKQIINISALLRRHKIKTLSSNIIGLPGETPEQAWETIHINQKIQVDLPWYSLMQYYPGTRIFEQARDKGLIAEDFDPGQIKSYFRNTYLRQPCMDELTNIHRFSILASWFPRLEKPLRFLAARTKPNVLYNTLFKITYAILTMRRARLSPLRILSRFNYYFRRLLA